MVKLPLRAGWSSGCSCLVPSLFSIGRTYRSPDRNQPRIRSRQCAAGLDYQRVSDRVCVIPSAGWVDCCTARATKSSYPGSAVVGRINAFDRADPSADAWRPLDVDGGSLRARRRRGNHLSCFKPVCRSMDSRQRARHGQRRHLFRGRSRSRADSTAAGRDHRRAWVARCFFGSVRLWV